MGKDRKEFTVEELTGEEHSDSDKPTVKNTTNGEHPEVTICNSKVSGESIDGEQSKVTKTNDSTVDKPEVEEETSVGSLGDVSSYWKDAVNGGFFATGIFIVSFFLLFAFSYTMSRTVLYALLLFSVVYMLFVFFESYYIYLDAKTISYHSETNPQDSEQSWSPNTYFWVFITLISPPMLDWLPPLFYAYIIRSQRTGTPNWILD